MLKLIILYLFFWQKENYYVLHHQFEVQCSAIEMERQYSSVSNKRAARSYSGFLFLLCKFQPAWSYYILHVY